MSFSWLIAAAAQVAAQTAAQTVATPAPVAAQPPAPAAAPASKVRAGDKVICREEVPIGTRFPHKVCFTAAQQEDWRQQDRANLERMQGLNSRCGIPGGPSC